MQFKESERCDTAVSFNADWPAIDSHYLAPECYANEYSWEGDVFSFGRILYELVGSSTRIPEKSEATCSRKTARCA
jgi:hypothetical protein